MEDGRQMNREELYRELPLVDALSREELQTIMSLLCKLGIDVDCAFTRTFTSLGLYHVLRDKMLECQVEDMNHDK